MGGIMNTVKHHCLVFQTDFGYKDSTVAAMYGVVKCTDPTCEIIDSTHELPQFDIWTASYRLWQQCVSGQRELYLYPLLIQCRYRPQSLCRTYKGRLSYRDTG